MMRIKSFEAQPFENIYDEYYMEHAQKCGSGSFGKVYLIQVGLISVGLEPVLSHTEK